VLRVAEADPLDARVFPADGETVLGGSAHLRSDLLCVLVCGRVLSYIKWVWSLKIDEVPPPLPRQREHLRPRTRLYWLSFGFVNY